MLKTFFFDHETLILFLFVMLIWMVSYWFIFKLEVSKDKKFELSIRNITAFSVFLVTYNIYISERSDNRIEKNRVTYNTLENIQRNWLNPQSDLLKDYPEGYFLYVSMTQDAGFAQPVPEKYDSTRREMLEVYSSIRIFQAMEDFLSTGTYDITGKYVWINNFLMWMQSPILRKEWTLLAFNYSHDTRELVDRIITESDKLILLRKEKGKLTADDYDNISNAFPVKFR